MPESAADNIFLRSVELSGLVPPERLHGVVDELRDLLNLADDEPVDDESLAQRLVSLELLNDWQVSQLKLGRTRFQLGPYRILDSIGEGGMGQVFLAEHQLLKQLRAIKVLPREKSTPKAIVNFHNEIRAQARLDHENLVRAFDAGEDGNVHYLVSEYVPGSDLRKLVKRYGPLDMFDAAEIVCQVAEALDYAHGQGMVHRDVKPGNVLVTPEGHAKLSDLGLAGPLNGSFDGLEDTRYGKVVGTADYISPDQLEEPTKPSPGWDIYSLGCTLYYAVTGKVPFPVRGSTLRRAVAHIQDDPIDPKTIVPDLDYELVAIIMKMIARESRDRIGSARDVVNCLRGWIERHRSGDEEQGRLESQIRESMEEEIPPRHETEEGSVGISGYLGPLVIFVLIPLAMIVAIILTASILQMMLQP